MYAEAITDLLKRYREVWQHAWKHRAEMEPPHRLRHELQFQPAALALQETPVHPAPRMVVWGLIGFAVLAVLWAFFGKIDIVATATGKIIPSAHTKVIQSFDTASVASIYVKDGQEVRAGEALIELDNTTEKADIQRIAADLSTMRFQRARSEAMLEAIATGVIPTLLVAGTDLASAPGKTEGKLLEGQFAEYTSRVAQIDAEIDARRAERLATQQEVQKLQQTLPLVQQRAADYKRLLGKKYVARHAYLEQEQLQIEMENDLAARRARLDAIDASLRETERRKVAFVAETRRELIDQLHQAEQDIVRLEQEAMKAEQRGRRMELTAPVDGTVQQLAVHTLGGVVTEAQPLMIIVPHQDVLEVDASLANKDIGFVRPGQAVEIKVDTFPFTRYGTIPGEIIRVSSDAIQDEKLGLVYSARIRLSRNSLPVENQEVKLVPGMAVTAEIKTGKRQLIEYFLSPLIAYKNESLRER